MSVLQVTGLTVESGLPGGGRLRAVDDLSAVLRAGHPRGPALDAAIHDLLRSVNLTPPGEVAAKHPHELSGGQRQRVATARALATARHFPAEIMVMYRGQIVEHGPADEVILRPAHPYTRILASAAPGPAASRRALAEARRQRQAVRAARSAELRETAAGLGCRFRSRCPHAMPVCQTRPPGAAAGPGQHALCWLYDPAARPGAA